MNKYSAAAIVRLQSMAVNFISWYLYLESSHGYFFSDLLINLSVTTLVFAQEFLLAIMGS